jgi:hypothetical protein
MPEPHLGQAKIYLDDCLVTTLDLQAAVTAYRQAGWVSNGLAAGRQCAADLPSPANPARRTRGGRYGPRRPALSRAATPARHPPATLRALRTALCRAR